MRWTTWLHHQPLNHCSGRIVGLETATLDDRQ